MNAPPTVRSFPPIVDNRSRLLVLGSMPGAASLEAHQYYAHPRNAFWSIMGEIAGADPELPYAARCERLLAAQIAVWDVLSECQREGSLDAAIEPHSEQANNFLHLFDRYPQLCRICFNGQKAESAWRRMVWPSLGKGVRDRLELARLPSTSPAHASRTLEERCSRSGAR